MSDVLVVGCGLLGTSTGLALQGSDLPDVTLWDSDAEAVHVAVARGAGRAWDGTERALVAVVAVPPAVTAQTLLELQRLEIAQTYTHVCSVQSHVQDEVERMSPDPSRVVGGHPLAGREVGGAAAGVADLFVGRTWAICPAPSSSAAAVAEVRRLAQACGAVPCEVPARAHDAAVALLSHLPQVAASALAGLLTESPEHPAMELSGPGLADTTRLAAGSPSLWTEVLEANAAQVAPQVRALARDLGHLAELLESLASPATPERGAQDGRATTPGTPTAEVDPTERAEMRSELEAFLLRGNTGRSLVPVKRGEVAGAFTGVRVDLADEPGELARLLLAAGEAGVNVEDVRLEHVPGRPRGVAELLVAPGVEGRLARALRDQGWRLVMST